MLQYIKFVLLIHFLNKCYCEFTNNVIDMDDILSEDFMPGTLLVLENPARGTKIFNASFLSLQSKKKILDGSFGNAMETMNFHRSMMNQYLCRNYVAEQIITDMTTSRIKRRMGHITPGSDTVSKSTKFQIDAQNNLLNDEGSTGYKDWLSKSTTLEDIYRHYDQAQNRIDDKILEEDDRDEEFDEEYNGHHTGYVYPSEGHGEAPAKHRGHTGMGNYYPGGGGYSYPNPSYHNGGGSGNHHGGGSEGYGGGSGYHHGGDGFSHDNEYVGGGYSDHEAGHSAYGGGHTPHEPEHIYHSYPPKYHGHHEESHSNKEHDLSDLFDIALTALAFLSFGLFIVHVIMCISAAHTNTTTTAASMMMPMSMSPTATATGGMMTNTGTGGGGGMTATGGGGTDMTMGGGAVGTGAGDGATGGDPSPGTSTGGEGTGTGMGGDSTGGGGGTGTGMGGDSTGGGGGTGMGGDSIGGGGSTGTGAGEGDGGAGATGGGTDTGGGATGDASPGTGTGMGGGTTGTGDGTTGTGGGNTGTGGGTTGTGGGADGNTDAGGTGDGQIRDTFKFRLRRDIPTITNPNNQALNELARRVLVSIEAAIVANNDDGVCLRKSLCENNKFSRTLDGKDKIIIPVWSLGMSWLSGRLVKGISPATSMLDTLKASILGLGKANCEIIYQECDLRRERTKRKRRRRKRNAA